MLLLSFLRCIPSSRSSDSMERAIYRLQRRERRLGDPFKRSITKTVTQSPADISSEWALVMGNPRTALTKVETTPRRKPA